MKLLTPPWKTAWYDDHLSERFFKEMSKVEKAIEGELQSTAEWMEQLMIEFGQLAQSMIQLEKSNPPATQIRLAYEKALKVSAMASHLAGSLKRSDPNHIHTPIDSRRESEARHGFPPEETRRVMNGVGYIPPVIQEPTEPARKTNGSSMRQTIISLSRRGITIPEIEKITGRGRPEIEHVLASA